MNKVLGRVVLRGTDVGIPRLRVSVYDTKSVKAPARSGRSSPARAAGESRWTRWGSVLTGGNGSFALTHEDENRTRSTGPRPNLALIVSAPEEGTLSGQDQRARIATCFRESAGESESFIIAVDKAQLEKAGVRSPDPETEIDVEIDRQRSSAQRQARFNAESQRVFVEKLKTRRKLERAAAPKFETFLSALSTVPKEQRRQPDGRFVARGASVRAANQAIIRSGIERRVNQTTVTGYAPLSEEQALQFKDSKGEFTTVSSTSVLELYRPNLFGRGPGRVRLVPASLLCRDQPVDPCVEILEGKEPADPPADEEKPAESPVEPAAANDEAVTAADIPQLIGRLVEQLSPPESTNIFRVNERAALGDVHERVQGFVLHSGPADEPALHDFHHLQIAFEHVWQELFDDGVVGTAKDLYTELVELGADPNEYLSDPGEINFGSLKLWTQATLQSLVGEPPTNVLSEFDITPKQWAILARIQRSGELSTIADEISGLRTERNEKIEEITAVAQILPGLLTELFNAEKQKIRMRYDASIREARQRGEHIIQYADHKLEAPEKFDQFHQLLADLEKAMKEPYRFSIYAANQFERSINFGIVATYRQSWEPVSYQVGKLVKTVPLAPKEVRRFSKKTTVRKSRAEKEVENNLRSRKTESAETVRAEESIVQKALNRTNFKMTAEGGVNIGIANAKGSAAFGGDAATESEEVKKEFREAVFKAAEEYKSERTVEINVNAAEETGFEESGEISNPNDEISVTYLFYELERRYRVSEQIHRIMPVVLVAQEFPNPSDIDDDWMVAHDWILRRVILDDSFIPAMNYLASKVVGDEFALQEMYQNLQQQRKLLDDIKQELVEQREQVGRRYAALQRSIERRAEALDAEEAEGFLSEGVQGLFGSTDVSPEAMQAREQAAKDAYERAAKQEKELEGRLERETTTVNALTETYTRNLSDHLNRRAQIARLRVHIKSNIMYYMQAIWSHEPPDHRYFRLHEVSVPKLTGKTTFKFEVDPDAIPMPPDWMKPHKLVVKTKLDAELEYETLEEVADLDNLLGFKGNYMMFPLRRSNALTDFMMIPYLDAITGIRDPDPLGNWTVSDLVEYACCLRQKLSRAEFDKLLPGLQAAYQQLFNSPGADGEEIVVPTDSLFIEALPGAHPILEDFKLFHRVVDVKKVQAEVRAAEFENLRAAARLLAGEREDPTIEKKVVIEGGKTVVVPPEDV